MAKPTLLLLAVLLTAIACRPTPSESIEYLHREDAIIIQMLAVGEEASEIDRALAVPEFTLYGDGTLIYQHETADGTRLVQTLLPAEAVQNLLEAIVDEGFLDFAYAQPAPGTASNETTFIYAHTLDRANAVSIRGSSAALPENAGNNFDEYRKLQVLIEMLRALDPPAHGAEEPVEYVPEEYIMVVEALDGTGVRSLRNTSISESGILQTLLDKFPDPTLEELAGPVPLTVERGNDQAIYFAPLLPYDENFPEFELQ